MTIWIVLTGYAHEGVLVTKVFATKEAAERERDEIQAGFRPKSDEIVEIQEHEVQE